jgi:formamidopyrimidine-DNA glycosylase
MSQEVIAGVGNLYADEILFQTGIHPRRAVDSLDDAEVRALYLMMRSVLRDVIARKARGATYPRKYLLIRREEGERCPRCRGTIRRTVVFGRTTYYCAKHQR